MGKVPDLIWRGRLQLGDEPGIYSDAQYSGLCLDLPVELLPYSGRPGNGEILFVIEASEVKVYQGYDGHPVTVSGLFEDQPGKWHRRPLVTGELNNKNHGRAELLLSGPIPRYVTVRIESNPQLPPGLYDEIVVNRLSVLSDTYYGYLGFRFTNPVSGGSQQ